MTNIANQPNFDNRLSQFFVSLVLGLAILSGFGAPILAQTPERPDRGTRPIGSYSVTDIEAISLTNGNVNLSIPLASLPPMAGGKLSWVLQGIYNSKMWDTTKTENQTLTIPPVKYIVTKPQLVESGSGWRIGRGYDLAFQESRLDFDWLIPVQGDPDYPFLVNNPNWYKVVLTTPDGANHELRPTDHQPYSGTRDYLRGYYRQTPITQGQPMRYYSVDGSYLYAIVNPPGQTILWTVYQNDGTRIVQRSNGIQEIIDANSNAIRLRWSTDPGTGLSVRHIEDSVTGREITYTYDPAGNGGNGQGLIRGYDHRFGHARLLSSF